MYFGDGNAAQYKKRTKFINIYCEQDFCVSPEWHFFGKSHEKGPADGIRWRVIRLAAKTSLQRVYNNQIQTPPELFNYCSSNIQNTAFIYVQEEQFLNKEKERAE
jgi:hypothetical protein